MNPSQALATVFVDELIRGGAVDAVLSPGSRSAPLAYALYEADAAGRLRLHVRIDERTAGFLALGLTKASRRPVPVVCTSGTAAANLHPAVLEASHASLPLVMLTADRPPELRGVGANQATDQIGLYGTAVRFFREVGAAEARIGQVAYWRALVSRTLAAANGSLSRDPGPVHLNVALREPLIPSSTSDGWSRCPVAVMLLLGHRRHRSSLLTRHRQQSRAHSSSSVMSLSGASVAPQQHWRPACGGRSSQSRRLVHGPQARSRRCSSPMPRGLRNTGRSASWWSATRRCRGPCCGYSVTPRLWSTLWPRRRGGWTRR